MKHLIIFLLLCSNVFAGTIDPGVDDQNYVEYAKKFTSVCRLKCIKNNDEIYLASGVAISDHWIITAAHAVFNAKNVIMIFDEEIKIDKIIVHKEFIPENKGYYDIAMCYTKKSIGLKNYPLLYVNNDEIQQICSISGYGATGTFVTGSKKNGDNLKRAGKNRIEQIYKHCLVCNASSKDDPKNTDLEFLSSYGDSGGGLFIGERLAGINSCVMALDKITDSNYGDESIHTRISIFAEWISNTKDIYK